MGVYGLGLALTFMIYLWVCRLAGFPGLRVWFRGLPLRLRGLDVESIYQESARW